MSARLLVLLAGLPFALGVTVGATAAPITAAAAGEPAAAVETLPDMPMAGMPMADMMKMHAADPTAMDAMHAAMAEQMPPELREACDEMHAAMSAGDAPMPMAGEPPAGMSGDHAAHHR